MKSDCYEEFVLHGAHLALAYEAATPRTKLQAVLEAKLDGYCEGASIIGFCRTPFAFKLALLEVVRQVGPSNVVVTGSAAAARQQRQEWSEKILASFSVMA